MTGHRGNPTTIENVKKKQRISIKGEFNEEHEAYSIR
jgi:hypothetical protein